MSNEELVARIQTGEKDLIEDLWNQVERLVAWKARRIMVHLENRADVDFDDLYQSGYLALMAAIQTYSPETGAFSVWLMYYLQNAFAEASGYRTKLQRNDPMRSHVSLDAPLDHEDGDTLGDLQADPDSICPFESVEDQICNEQLHSVLDELLDQLKAQQAEVIRQRYFSGLTYAEIGESLNISGQYARCLEDKGIRVLRKPAVAKYLRPFIDFDYYGGTGLQSFRYTGFSVQERYMIKLEKEMERRYREQREERSPVQ